MASMNRTMLQELVDNPDKIAILAKCAFEAVDTDKSGSLERNELEAVMSSVSMELDFEGASKEDIDDLMEELDTKGDGNISLP